MAGPVKAVGGHLLYGHGMEDVPQLWDLDSASSDGDDLAMATEVAQAELASIDLARRFAGGVGHPVRLLLSGEVALRGTLLAALADGVVVADDGGPVIVPLSSVRLAEVAGSPRPVEGRRGVRGEARELVGAGVTVLVAGGGAVSGRLTGVGSDHLVVAGGGSTSGSTVIVPLAATTLLRRR